ncbi:hypothetical protein H0H87_012027 [Tephrocybe sp. NHM501043]|nr:hypothetical protein H0H87_012027 [Tephrocybe sp. NHM501043]
MEEEIQGEALVILDRDIVAEEDNVLEDEFGNDVNEQEANLSSAFSVTTTSTSNYVKIDMFKLDDDSSFSTWSTLEAPTTPTLSRLFNEQRQVPARLKKPRPVKSGISSPFSPSEVLQRPNYNHSDSEASPSSSSRSSKRKAIPAFIRKIGIRKLKISSYSSKEAR